ncbi:MAG: proline--tRNA ligase [Erysipelotrichaceae bacterium]
MKLSNSFFYTLRENAKDEDSVSSNLLVRSGMVKKSSSGVYMYMPLGYKVLKNIENIVRDEMNKINASELLMPSLIPEDVYIASGRRESFGNSMFALHDRFNKPFVLGPTHEELFAIAASMKIKSYKDLPFSLYQFQNKFRDEPRPRYGLIRVREFIMKDAYSFDRDLDGLHTSYMAMFNAYKNIFDRLHLDYRIVKADTGVMGGLLSEEFQAISDIGEDTIVLCDSCDLSNNIEITPTTTIKYEKEELLEKELVYTPNAKTIEEVAEFLNQPIQKFVKTLIYQANDKVYALLVSGDREVNEAKVMKLLNVSEITLADFDIVEKVTKAKVGFAGPIGLDIDIIVDHNVMNMYNFIVGGNQSDYHYINVNVNDFKPTIIGDITNVKEGDICPNCGGKIYFNKGIEVGNTFKLGTKYSKALGLEYLDNNNQLQDVYMGSYGIGPGRCMAAIAQQYNDENGIIWPKEVAPFQVGLVLISNKDELQVQKANEIYQMLKDNNIDVLFDDRDERPGVKFKDMELIGLPCRIVVGKNIVNEQVEYRQRTSDTNELINIDQIIEYINK